MEELIKITTREDGTRAVNARDLHFALNIKTDFTTWCNRMFEYGFEENVDYSLLKNGEADNQLFSKSDYVLTTDCAEEIAMLQRTEQGKKVRQYFIACKKKLFALSIPSYAIEDSVERAKIWIKEEEERKRLASIVNDQSEYIALAAPKVEYAEKVLSSVSDHTTTTIANELGISAIALNKKLKDAGVQYKHEGNWILYAKYKDKGLNASRTHPYMDSMGNIQTEIRMVWTEEGRNFIHKLFNDKLK